MSLFKVRDWWSTKVGVEEEFDQGCLCVANVNNNAEKQDQIITGSFQGMLRIYNPQPKKTEHGWSGFQAQHLLLETAFQLPILQVAVGQFVSGSENKYLAILHPQKLSVYGVTGVLGHVEQGNQYQIHAIYEHNLQRSAFNFCYGPFGNIYGKDFICVQSLDGTVSVFEQESYAFSRFLPNALIPGPLKYIPSTDCFITVSSKRQVECYKYQVLAVATDVKSKEESQNMKQGKRVTANWIYSIEDQALDIDIITYHSQETSCVILILGERYFYLLTESGTLHCMKKLEYNPSCFCAYIPNSIKFLVATHSSSLLVYQDIELLWAAKMDQTPVQVSTGVFQGINGLVVSLTQEGHLQCSYLGSDPDLFTPPLVEARDIRYEDIDKEITDLNRRIKDMSNRTGPLMPQMRDTEAIEISSQMQPGFKTIHVGYDHEEDGDSQVPLVTFKIVFTTKILLENITVNINILPPLFTDHSEFEISSLEPNKTKEVFASFYLGSQGLPTSLSAQVCASYLWPSTGSSRQMTSIIKLPLYLVVKPCPPVKNANHKITIESNQPSANLNNIFPEFVGMNPSGPGSALGFQFYNGPVVTVLASKSDRYRLQCDSFEAIYLLADQLVNRLKTHFDKRQNAEYKLSFSGNLPLQEYFEIINTHFEHRLESARCKAELAQKTSQFRAIQRRLLIKYKDKSPTPLSGLDVIMEETYRQILMLADVIEGNTAEQELAANSLSCATRLLNFLIRLWYPDDMTDEEFDTLNTVLSPTVSISEHQGWEESVDAAITHLLRTVLSKNAKDTTINPVPFSLPVDTTKVCKHITTFCDKLGKGARLVRPTNEISSDIDAACSTKLATASVHVPNVDSEGCVVAEMEQMSLSKSFTLPEQNEMSAI